MALTAETRGQMRLLAPDHYYALRYLPGASTGMMVGLYAFLLEIQRVPGAVSNAPLGEIRLQWWREALAEIVDFVSSHCHAAKADPPLRAHPVVRDIAHGLVNCLTNIDNPQANADGPAPDVNWVAEIEKSLTMLINHRSRLLYDTPFATPLEAYEWLQAGDGALASSGARLVIGIHDPHTSHDGIALNLVRRAEALGALARHRAVPIPGLKLSGDDGVLVETIMQLYHEWIRDMRALNDCSVLSLYLPFLLPATMAPVYARHQPGNHPPRLSRHWRFMKAFISGRL